MSLQSYLRDKGEIGRKSVKNALVPSENTARPHPPSSLSKKPCLHQGKAQDYLCVDCLELVCFKCTRNTHKNHTIELLDDLLQEDESVMNSWTKIRTTIYDKLGRLNNLVSLSDDILSLIDEIINLKTEFQAWKDSLVAQKVSTEQDLQAWHAPATGVIEGKRQECKEMLCRLKLKPQENMEIPEIKARLSAALKKCDSLQIQGPAVTATARQCAGAGAAVLRVQNDLQATPPQGATTGATPRTFQAPGLTSELPPYDDSVPWTVTSRAEEERAVARLRNNIKPSRLVVLSTNTRPIPRLGELLSRLAAHHTGDISLLPLDHFWRPAGQADGGMAAIINNLSGRLDTMYVSNGQVGSYLSKRFDDSMQRGRLYGVNREDWPCKIGVRFDSDNDVWTCEILPYQIDDVCCVRGTPLQVCSDLWDFDYTVNRWHFPDLCDEDLDWMIGILQLFRDSRLRVVLPRNDLTATGARRLFEELPQIREVYHDPGAAHLTSAGSAPDRTFFELSTNNIIKWM
ncbi:uncharacterized protein LOC108674504 [Hyalella azteca]|uniref:Uncharacterized protein LOC108674504 n=1 Tax=Hyalella azteca TaxID=294128 RepID=A0A8B7NYJ8_HYAAZ|nr:uncharacterized protein LOC108674504 [Hyalella azteca]